MPTNQSDRRGALAGLAALALLAGCAGREGARAQESQGETPGDEGPGEAPDLDLSPLVGMSLRVVPKDGAMTMDYRPDRLTIVLGDDERIELIHVG